MRRRLDALRHYWFAPERPFTLPLTRAVLVVVTALTMLPHAIRLVRQSIRRPIEFMHPPYILDLLPIPYPLTDHGITVLASTLLAAGLLAAIGLGTRFALLVYVVGFLYLGAVDSSWGFMAHAHLGVSQVLMVLLIAPGTDAYSADRLLAWWRRRRGGALEPLGAALAGPAVSRWGTRLLLALVATIFLAAGVSKVRHGGARWADGQTLGFYLSGGTCDGITNAAGEPVPCSRTWTDAYTEFAGPVQPDPTRTWRDGYGIENYLYQTSPTTLGRKLAQHRLLLVLLAAGTMLFELSAPVLLGPTWLRNAYLVGAMGFLLGINYTMPVGFLSWMTIMLCAIDWRVARPTGPVGRLVLRREVEDGLGRRRLTAAS